MAGIEGPFVVVSLDYAPFHGTPFPSPTDARPPPAEPKQPEPKPASSTR